MVNTSYQKSGCTYQRIPRQYEFGRGDQRSEKMSIERRYKKWEEEGKNKDGLEGYSKLS